MYWTTEHVFETSPGEQLAKEIEKLGVVKRAWALVLGPPTLLAE